jgi:hypothetical protein
MRDFLTSLSPAIATVTRLVLWDADELAVPVQPGRMEMGNLPSAESKPTAKQTNEPRLETSWGRQVSTGF